MPSAVLPPLLIPRWQPVVRFPPLSLAEVHVWRIDLDRPTSPAERGLLDDQERQRGERVSGTANQRRFEAGRVSRRLLLGAYLQCDPGILRFSTADRGKPRLNDGLGLEFNLSHCAGLALLAIARGQAVGVDLERVRSMPRAARIAERTFSAAETEWLETLPVEHRNEAFFRTWTAFEARQKLSGAGLFGRRPVPYEVDGCAFTPAPGFVAALAWPESAEAIAVRYFQFDRPPFRP